MAIGFSQTNPIDFESTTSGDWPWAVFENNDNPPLNLVANPDPTGANTSATVAEFTARDAATGSQPYAGCVNNTGEFSTFTLDATNSIVKIMVYKSVISDVGIKFEADLASTGEIKVANTLINQWEEITFDFSSKIGEPSSTNINGIVVFPDFDLAGRTQDNIVYFDNITFSGVPAPTEPTMAAPTPTQDAADVISMFSDAYTDVAVDTWQTVWSASTYDDMYAVAGNATKKYTNLDFNGIETTGANLIDASGMTHVHMDVWTPDTNDFKLKLVDFGADQGFDGGDDTEHEVIYTAPATGEWISYDIPLSDFTGLTNTNNIAQMIVSKGPLGTVYIDNVYFYYEMPPASLEDITFEPGEAGNAWTWNVFENNDNPPLNIIANPDATGANTSATVAEYTARDSATGAQPYAGTVSNDIPTFTLDATNSTVKIMVWKSVISDVGIKFEAAFASTGEIKVANTLVNQWEELTFDFSGKIGEASSTDIDGIVIFPDFDLAGRTQDNVVYFDNITFSAQTFPTEPTVAAPTPTQDPANVISMFSDAYTDVPVDTWRTVWSASTYDDMYAVAGNATKKYTDLDFNGVETTGANLIDASGMTHIHMDIWTPDANDFKLKLVDFGADEGFDGGDDTEHEVIFATPATGEWISYDIPLTDFTGLTNTDNIAQLIISKGPLGTLYVDNVYYYTTPPTEPMVAAPTPPARNTDDVVSIYTENDVYADVTLDELPTGWSQLGAFEEIQIDGNNTWKITDCEFLGMVTNYANGIDLTLMNVMHIDYWTPDAIDISVKLVNTIVGQEEIASLGTTVTGSWQSIEIDMSNFSSMVTALDQITQILIDPASPSLLYIDNFYFYKGMPLSIADNNDISFLAYPNPSANNWNVKSNQNITSIQVFDTLGKQVLSLTPNTQEFVIDATSLNNGLYFARLHSEAGTETLKLIKK